jgi:enolase
MSSSIITHIDGYSVLDSRGNPTIEAEVHLADGSIGRGITPSGASTGQFEALELRDNDPACYLGKSVHRAVGYIRGELSVLLKGLDALDQAAVDRAMIEADGTPNKSRFGANAILAVSMAVARAAAISRGIPLHAHLGPGTLIPLPEIQILGGGLHAGGRIDVQDFMVIITGARDYDEVLEKTFLIHRKTGEILKREGRLAGVADEGGYWPNVSGNEAAFDILIRAMEAAGCQPGKDASISLDIAASDLYHDGFYWFRSEGKRFTREEFAELMIRWLKDFPVVSVEDPMADVDWEGWETVGRAMCHRVQIVGDDLFTTHLERIREGVVRGAANAVLIKLNQVGTVTETLEAIRATQAAGWLPVISARSGETEDAFISHLAVATDAGQLKVGSLTRSERNVKWNELIRIRRGLDSRATFIGGAIYDRILKTGSHQ